MKKLITILTILAFVGLMGCGRNPVSTVDDNKKMVGITYKVRFADSTIQDYIPISIYINEHYISTDITLSSTLLWDTAIIVSAPFRASIGVQVLGDLKWAHPIMFQEIYVEGELKTSTRVKTIRYYFDDGDYIDMYASTWFDIK